MKAAPPREEASAGLELIERLRLCSFDAAIIFIVFSQNPFPAALTAYLAGGSSCGRPTAGRTSAYS